MSDVLEGRCLCGAVKIRVEGAHDPHPGACHCRMCQRWSGGLFLCFEADAEAVTVEGPVARYQSSAFAERAFCSTCGSHLWMRDVDKEGGPYDLMPGLFDDALAWPLRSEIYADRAMAAVRLQGGHKRATRDQWEAQNPFIDGDV
ncbi:MULTISPECIES: GFA family protein [unclassified Leisingera]|uniref:GFA family protein n=1 Tax=unclassified Leisingera TaxID=2614906 RepID=UPI0002EF9671|nr:MULTISPECIES: GFA family protein [unclassified Leisingera]KIC21943.1 aldehyde-activating protein [Leisingera sp. ANG-S3]KIC50266.1 aldehyde-activating protein [Leisingera sp. ANG-S]KID07630.1 aldehyde-activating protein [Leisingera sp. ANG1]